MSVLEVIFSLCMLFAGFLVIAKKNFLPYFLPFAMGASPYLTALSVIPALLINYKKLKRKLPMNLSYLFVIWFAYACISMVTGEQKITTITEIIQLALGILFFRYIYNFCRTPQGLKNTCLSILFSGSLLSLLEILIFLTNSNIDTTSFLGVTPHNYGSYYIIFSNISLFILSGVLIIDNINFEESFKLSILTITNTTTSEMFGVWNVDFINLLTTSKLCLIIFMIIGKIELISAFLIIKKIFFKN